ncbi:MAG: hypothetical protein ABIR36_11440 [Nitrospiraceae bacterium]
MMYVLPIGIVPADGVPFPRSASGALSNLALVTIGHILGGTLLVALVYWFGYFCAEGEEYIRHMFGDGCLLKRR